MPLGDNIKLKYKGYRMVSFNLKVLAKFGLCSNCSEKLHGCSLARAHKKFCNRSHAHILVKMGLIARNFVDPAL